MDAVIRTRINSELKEKANEILQECGLTMSTALRLFLEQIVIKEGLPFEIDRKPSARLRESMRQAKELSSQSNGRFADVDALMDSLNDGKE